MTLKSRGNHPLPSGSIRPPTFPSSAKDTRKTLQHADRVRALAIADSMQQADVVLIDPKIPMADSLIYIAARKEFRHPLDSKR